MSEVDMKTLVSNQHLATKNFSSERLEQIDYKMHDYYQEYTDSHPDLIPEEIVQRLAYGIYIRHQPSNRKELIEEFMFSNLGKLYVIMVKERRELQDKGRLSQ
ncbi:hypothetical protein A3K64_03215 [Candidatus Micrarchaeota archaeon RBG_16_36_9]|nr:MAG: hypothetical protein A3K64_03215 [Candidatus Micrarchaeota archaeon RBG_16_36_9]